MRIMQDNDDVKTHPSTLQVDTVEDMLCLQMGIIPMSICRRHKSDLSRLFQDIDPEEARKMKRKFRKLIRQFSNSKSRDRKLSASEMKHNFYWKLRLIAFDSCN